MTWHYPPITGNPHLPVLAELPEGAVERNAAISFGCRKARLGTAGYFHCPRCGGWIEGHPIERRENTLAPLSGRKGISTLCSRCGWELAFSGMVS